MSDYLCIKCGEKAAFMTSLDGQAQTFYCRTHAPHPPTPTQAHATTEADGDADE